MSTIETFVTNYPHYTFIILITSMLLVTSIINSIIQSIVTVITSPFTNFVSLFRRKRDEVHTVKLKVIPEMNTQEVHLKIVPDVYNKQDVFVNVVANKPQPVTQEVKINTVKRYFDNDSSYQNRKREMSSGINPPVVGPNSISDSFSSVSSGNPISNNHLSGNPLAARDDDHLFDYDHSYEKIDDRPYFGPYSCRWESGLKFY